MSKIKTFFLGIFARSKTIVQNFNWRTWGGYGLSVVLLIFLIRSCSNQPAPCKDCAELEIAYIDSIKQLHTVISSYQEYNPPATDTIYIPGEDKIEYRDHTTFVKYWHQAQEYQQFKIRDSIEDVALREKLNITKSQFDSIVELYGALRLDATELTRELPIMETIKSDSTSDYKYTTTIWSKDPLEYFSQNIEVYPKTITVNKTEKEFLKKNNFLAIKGGAFFIEDLANTFYVPSIQYGHKWWTVEAGLIMDNIDLKPVNLNVVGGEVKMGFVIKWK